MSIQLRPSQPNISKNSQNCFEYSKSEVESIKTSNLNVFGRKNIYFQKNIVLKSTLGKILFLNMK